MLLARRSLLGAASALAAPCRDTRRPSRMPRPQHRGPDRGGAAARREPGRLTVGTQGVGSAGHISLLRREIAVTTANLGEALTFAAQQPWRTLGVMAESRHPMAPDVPTFKEAGYDLRGGSLRGLGGPKRLPVDVVARLSTEVERVIANPEFRTASERAFQPLRYLNSADYVAYLRAADETHRALWRVRPWNQ